jgi:hypothetical protein
VEQSGNNTNFTCYGYGHPGVIRRNCPKCNNKPVSAAPDVQFCLLDIKPLGRPAIKIQIHGVPGTAYIDSGARTSLPSAQLYHIFAERGHKFLPTTVQLVQADGSSTLTNVKTETLPVKEREGDRNDIHHHPRCTRNYHTSGNRLFSEGRPGHQLRLYLN